MTDKIPRIGSKAQVYHGTCRMTSGGLTKKDLMKHKGRIISRKKHAAGKRAIKFLFEAGYKPTKGTFKVMRKSMAKKSSKKSTKKTRHSRRRHTRRRGGFMDASGGNPLAGVMKAMGAK
jgi:hypothetical protein